jgi:hypothetical protein
MERDGAGHRREIQVKKGDTVGAVRLLLHMRGSVPVLVVTFSITACRLIVCLPCRSIYRPFSVPRMSYLRGQPALFMREIDFGNSLQSAPVLVHFPPASMPSQAAPPFFVFCPASCQLALVYALH